MRNAYDVSRAFVNAFVALQRLEQAGLKNCSIELGKDASGILWLKDNRKESDLNKAKEILGNGKELVFVLGGLNPGICFVDALFEMEKMI